MPETKTKTILVADDTPPLRHIVGIYLKQAGYQVIEASDGEMALTKVKENDLDLIFLDVMMPKMDGYTVCKKLREIEKYKNIPVVVCTAKGGQDDVVVALKSGANDYVVKPFSKDAVMKKIEKFLGPPPAAVKAAAEAKAAHEQAQQKHGEQSTPPTKEAPDKSTKTLQTQPPAKDASTQPSSKPPEPVKPAEPLPPKVPPKPPEAPKS